MERLGHMNKDNASSEIMRIGQCILEVNEKMYSPSVDNRKYR
jgi:hypothetical protein